MAAVPRRADHLDWSQPTGFSYGTAAHAQQQARGELTLTQKLASSPLPPIPRAGSRAPSPTTARPPAPPCSTRSPRRDCRTGWRRAAPPRRTRRSRPVFAGQPLRSLGHRLHEMRVHVGLEMRGIEDQFAFERNVEIDQHSRSTLSSQPAAPGMFPRLRRVQHVHRARDVFLHQPASSSPAASP